MPRPKGSKNKQTNPANIDEQITAVSAEIEELKATIKAKKGELKKLEKSKLQADQAAAAKKNTEDQKLILEAVKASGLSVDEILALLK